MAIFELHTNCVPGRASMISPSTCILSSSLAITPPIQPPGLCSHLPFYSPTLVYWRRLMRRMAFFFSTRRFSLFETNQRFRRIVLKTPLLTTFLRKRLSNESCDSFGRNTTEAIVSHLPSPEEIKSTAIFHAADTLPLINLLGRTNTFGVSPLCTGSVHGCCVTAACSIITGFQRKCQSPVLRIGQVFSCAAIIVSPLLESACKKVNLSH